MKLCKNSGKLFKSKLTKPLYFEETIQKSKFIVHINYVESLTAGFQYLDEVKDLRANHNCWAYRGDNENDFRVSDDGEPASTTGKPILSAIDSFNLVNTFAIVTRYFGGIKLGTGGLIRAYHGVTKNCLEMGRMQENCFQEYIPEMKLQLEIPFDKIGSGYRLISKFGTLLPSNSNLSTPLDCETINLKIPSHKYSQFVEEMQDLMKGSAKITPI
jgi:uncharacterized YigZ family protein